MPITVRDRYKEIFQAHRSASEYRLKILAAWGGRIAEFEMMLDGKKIAEYRATARIYFEIER